MMDQKAIVLKSKRKYASNLRQMAFGGDAEGEILVEESIFDAKGNLTEFRKWEDGGCETNRYTYDENGRVLLHELELEPDGAYEKWVFERDDQGRVLKETRFYGDDEGERMEYLYDQQDTPVSIKRYDSDGELESVETFEYNVEGDLINHRRTDATGNIQERSEITYQTQGQPASKSVFDPNGTVSSMEIFYDDLGRIVRATERNSDGVLVSDIQTQYDERGNVLMRKIRDFNPRVLRFEYDDADRILTEEILDGNGNLIMRNTMEYDDAGQLVSETEFWLDVGRGTSHKNSVSRFEYEFHD